MVSHSRNHFAAAVRWTATPVSSRTGSNITPPLIGHVKFSGNPAGCAALGIARVCCDILQLSDRGIHAAVLPRTSSNIIHGSCSADDWHALFLARQHTARGSRCLQCRIVHASQVHAPTTAIGSCKERGSYAGELCFTSSNFGPSM